MLSAGLVSPDNLLSNEQVQPERPFFDLNQHILINDS